MGIIVYNNYFNMYSRLLAKENGISIELNLTPVHNWNEVSDEIIRAHFTSRDAKDKVMGVRFFPSEVKSMMENNLGGFFTNKLLTYDYLGHMYKAFNISTVEELYNKLNSIPNNGGMRWAGIWKEMDKYLRGVDVTPCAAST